ncbi:MAG: EAL domain-containing protein [Pseudonocardiaceae bacterium]|nr:EAL domain-containing protein [Pseudonocardiaceae bacterium]
MTLRKLSTALAGWRAGLGFAVFAALALLASAAAFALASTNWSPQSRDLIAGAVLAVAFVVARKIAIEVDVRESSWRITLTEIPVVVGLFLVPAPVVALAFASVTLVARLLRRDAPAKLIFNVACSTMVVAATAITAEFVVRPLAVTAPDWAVILVSFLVGHALTSVLGLVGIRLAGAGGFRTATRLMLHTYVTGVLAAVAGLVAVEVVLGSRWGWVLVVLLATCLAAIYRTYYGLLRDQRDLGVLNQVSLRVASAARSVETEGVAAISDDHDVWVPALELAREQLNATRVVLHRRVSADQFRTVVAGEPLARTLTCSDVRPVLAVPAGKDADGVRRVTAGTADPSMRVALGTREVAEALVVCLHGAGQLLGAIEVHDRQSRLRGFDRADLRLVETLASHLTTAMDNRRLLAQLRHDAYHDTLTDLRNRLGFREEAGEVLRHHERYAVLVIDLDLQSSVNDALGHAWGDRIVLAAGSRLADQLPAEVIIARLEGDIFAALLVDCDDEEAMGVAEQVRAALCAPYPVDKLEVETAARVGIALNSIEPTSDVDVLLQRADVALQAARLGDDGVRSYVPSMGQVFLRRFQLVTQFRQALDTGQVDVHFQPKLALASREVIGVEALVRWQHPEFGMLDPEEFVAVVEATGLIDALTGFVVDRALAQCKVWLDRGLGLSVAVNLSVRNLADAEFPERVTEALQRHGVPPALLGFELTESAVMSDPERALPVLRRLHGLGVRIAVDDFGTGYSSLAYLRRLPVDEVKIDKSFVLGMGSDLSDLAVVRAIVDLGHSLGLSVVAEGVEEDVARDQLIEMGCDVAQGYLISRPLGRERFEAWLRARTMRARGHRDEAVLTLVR